MGLLNPLAGRSCSSVHHQHCRQPPSRQPQAVLHVCVPWGMTELQLLLCGHAAGRQLVEESKPEQHTGMQGCVTCVAISHSRTPAQQTNPQGTASHVGGVGSQYTARCGDPPYEKMSALKEHWLPINTSGAILGTHSQVRSDPGPQISLERACGLTAC